MYEYNQKESNKGLYDSKLKSVEISQYSVDSEYIE